MRNFSDMYEVQDDHIWTCYFKVKPFPDEKLDDKNYLNNIYDKLVKFHLDYIDLSQKFQMAEIRPQPFLTNYDINLSTKYTHFLYSIFEQDKYLAFFPYWHNDKLGFKVDYPSSNLLTLAIGNKIDTLYTYSSNFTIVKTINNADFNQFTNFDSDLMRVSAGQLKREDTYQIYFSIEIYSDIWFETVSRNRRLWDKSYGEPYLDYDDEEHEEPSLDNRYIAYRNTPRLNSFLRDLKTLFVDKYGWSYDSDYEDIRKDGIPLDGKIIYQEDIDEGRVQLPDIESFGKVVEAGRFF